MHHVCRYSITFAQSANAAGFRWAKAVFWYDTPHVVGGTLFAYDPTEPDFVANCTTSPTKCYPLTGGDETYMRSVVGMPSRKALSWPAGYCASTATSATVRRELRAHAGRGRALEMSSTDAAAALAMSCTRPPTPSPADAARTLRTQSRLASLPRPLPQAQGAPGAA